MTTAETVFAGSLRRAGFADVVVETADLTGRAAKAREVALGFCQGSPLRGEIEGRAPNRRAEVTERRRGPSPSASARAGSRAE